ncbi:hypothetical protein BDV19DRAFT_354711 [Aspergillus venezuelensis]
MSAEHRLPREPRPIIRLPRSGYNVGFRIQANMISLCVIYGVAIRSPWPWFYG